MSSNSDLVIDHTFNRNKNFHKNANQKILVGQNFFSFFCISQKKRKEILY